MNNQPNQNDRPDTDLSWLPNKGAGMDAKLEAVAAAGTPTTTAKRLTAAQVVNTIQKLTTQASTANDYTQALGKSTPQSFPDDLREIIKNAKAMIANAERLLEANQ